MKSISYNKFIQYPALVSDKNMVRILNGKYVIKLADCDLNHLLRLQTKRIDKVETPRVLYEMDWKDQIQYLYTTHYFRNYYPFSEHVLTCSTEEYVILILKMMRTVKRMHQQGLFSQDLRNTRNILIDDHLDYRFIDLDYSIVDGQASLETEGELYASYPEVYFHYCKSLDFLEQARITNKLVLLDFLVKGLTEGKVDDDTPTILEEGTFPKDFEEELFAIFTGQREIKEEDYLEEFLYLLIEEDYRSVALSENTVKRKKIS